MPAFLFLRTQPNGMNPFRIQSALVVGPDADIARERASEITGGRQHFPEHAYIAVKVCDTVDADFTEAASQGVFFNGDAIGMAKIGGPVMPGT
ncbi:MAG: hypothetical protein IT548_18030 [Alphaproteobacteria bacterium]|nr:hypothetical protein [Alphaproteobacteria bacterium]